MFSYLAWGAESKELRETFGYMGNFLLTGLGIVQTIAGLILGIALKNSFWSILMSITAGIATAEKVFKNPWLWPVNKDGPVLAEKFRGTPYMMTIGLLTVPLFGYHVAANLPSEEETPG